MVHHKSNFFYDIIISSKHYDNSGRDDAFIGIIFNVYAED